MAVFNHQVLEKYRDNPEEANRIIAENKRLVGLWLDAQDRRVSATLKWEHDEKEYQAACKAEQAAYDAAIAYQKSAV